MLALLDIDRQTIAPPTATCLSIAIRLVHWLLLRGRAA